MCRCTPNIKTPFCGKGDCAWPNQKEKYLIYWKPNTLPAERSYPEYDVIEVEGLDQTFLESVRLRELGTDIRVYKRILLKVETV